ncbi:ATP-binding cassette domain-containing protein [Thalassotalea agarivorans]|uniref:ATP-binding cassette domain-containing protein n=1 Tax=Thalassotalea agarivorans TaxID=349064 RepID=UPI001C4337CC|nr:ATP-binding cassette domain-containing protein [Thalassotalea agarivorans]
MIKAESIVFMWPKSSSFTLSIDHLTVTKGEKVFIQGASGCGKTTLLSLLSGVNRTHSGQLSVLGSQLSSLSGGQRDQFRADHIGVVFQLFNLLPYLTAIENVVLACKFSKQRAQKAIAKSGSLEQEAIRLLAKLELSNQQLLNKPVGQLSIGQQQRIAAARALIGSPDIIIADEPTSSLDHEVSESFLDLLFTEIEACNATLLFVSHDTRLKERFDSTWTLMHDQDKQESRLLLTQPERSTS